MPPAPPAPSEMNGLVYQYLVAAGLSSTAKKFKKEASFSGTTDDCDHSLVDIFHFYRTHRAQLESTDAETDAPAKKRRKLINGESEKVKDVVEEEQKEPVKPQTNGSDTITNVTEKKSKKKNKTKKKDKSKKESATKTKEAVESQPTEKKAKKSKKSKKKNKKEKKVAKEAAETVTAEPEPESPNGDEDATTSATVAEVETPTESNAASSDEPAKVEQKKGKKRRRSAPAPNEPFQRVKPLESYEPWQDNRYNPISSYGAKAHADLIVTRGKGFRHEKTKKKRGSYRGGTISMASNSFKF